MKAAMLLIDSGVGSIASTCTTGSLFDSIGHEENLRQKLSSLSCLAATVTAESVLKALKLLGAETISVVTPYTDYLNARERKFLEDNDIAVREIRGMQIIENESSAKVTSETILNGVEKLTLESVDAILLSCTNMPTFDVIETIEKQYGMPVISSNSSTLLDILMQLGMPDIPVPGMTFRTYVTKHKGR